MVSWGRAWRAALAWLGWSIVWGIVGVILVGAGIVTIVGTSYNSFLSGNGVSTGSGVAGSLLIAFGMFIWFLGGLAAFFKINAEVVSEEVNRRNQMTGSAPQSVPSQVVAAAGALSVCPTCGGPLRYIQQYQRWYCDREQRYV